MAKTSNFLRDGIKPPDVAKTYAFISTKTRRTYSIPLTKSQQAGPWPSRTRFLPQLQKKALRLGLVKGIRVLFSGRLAARGRRSRDFKSRAFKKTADPKLKNNLLLRLRQMPPPYFDPPRCSAFAQTVNRTRMMS
jgi:hypothetical protein